MEQAPDIHDGRSSGLPGDTLMLRVEWLREAVGDLAELWIEADSLSRQAITKATHFLDQELQADPFREIYRKEAKSDKKDAGGLQAGRSWPYAQADHAVWC